MSLRVDEAEKLSPPLSLRQTQEAPYFNLKCTTHFFFSVLQSPPLGHAQIECRTGQTEFEFVVHQVAHHWQKTALKVVKYSEYFLTLSSLPLR